MSTNSRTPVGSDSDTSTVMPDLPTWATLRDDEDRDVDMDAEAKGEGKGHAGAVEGEVGDVDMDADLGYKARSESPRFRPENEEPLFRPDTPPPQPKAAPTTAKRSRPSASPAPYANKKARKEFVLQNIWDIDFIANNLRSLDHQLMVRGLAPLTPSLRAAIALGAPPTPDPTMHLVSRSQPADEGLDLAIQNDVARQLFGSNADEYGYQHNQPQRISSPAGCKSKGKAHATPIKSALRIRNSASTTPPTHRVGQLPQLPRQVRFASESPETSVRTSFSNRKATGEPSSEVTLVVAQPAFNPAAVNLQSDSLEKAARKINELVKGKKVLSDEELNRLSLLVEFFDENHEKLSVDQIKDSGLGVAIKGLSAMDKEDVPYDDEHKLLKRAQRLTRLWKRKLEGL
ncbi:hypothetical protein CALCODRAFT_478912 [Calocera cornea HHB12733]|uniref:Uncharacterized protein n=1 Tax=Calocera cornea HHB12733 TaxID=1353952 RepID=A0A165K358_9BASI|nr:hypothetical protein CALCODRAFT_478912 [Calocera cornea HHB12733]